MLLYMSDISPVLASNQKKKEILIVNPGREHTLREFKDRTRSVAERYYASFEKAEEEFESEEEVEQYLNGLIKADRNFFEPYLELAEILADKDDYASARAALYRAFEGALRLIVDKNGVWPLSLPGAWPENRHIIRAIDRFAHELWEEGDTQGALDIYRKLFRSDPIDQVGARFYILSILLKLPPHWEEEEENFQGALPGLVDGAKLDEWFETEAKKFPQEFEGWYLKDAGDQTLDNFTIQE